MSAAEIFDSIAALPAEDKAALVARLARETDLLEELQDVMLFDTRQNEESVSLDGHFRRLGLEV